MHITAGHISFAAQFQMLRDHFIVHSIAFLAKLVASHMKML